MNRNNGGSVARLIGLTLAVVGVCAVMSSCSSSPDKYAQLNELSVANDRRPSSSEISDVVQGGQVSVTELPATFSEPEYSFDPQTGKYVRVYTPNMYSSKIPDKYVVSTSPSPSSEQSSESSQSSKDPEPPEPPQPAVPQTNATGTVAELTSAQREKIETLINSDYLDKESFENTQLGTDQMIGAALLLGKDQIQYGFDTYIKRDILFGLSKDLFGKAPTITTASGQGGSDLKSSYIFLKSDKCNIKKMPESEYYSKNIDTIYDVGNDYYKVEAELYSNETKAGNAVYIIKADSAAKHGYVIAAQKIN